MRDEFLELLRNDAHRIGQYKLSSGRTSEHYINCKPVTLSGKGLAMVSDMILDLLEPDTVAVGGLTLGADPLVAGVAMGASLLDWDLAGLIVRKQAKGHGTGAWIEGPILPEGSKVVVLEDVITTGGSAIKAATRLRDAGYTVDRVVAIVDRQVNNEAYDFFEQEGLDSFSLYNLEDIAAVSYTHLTLPTKA